jgi:hypothetical protein
VKRRRNPKETTRTFFRLLSIVLAEVPPIRGCEDLSLPKRNQWGTGNGSCTKRSQPPSSELEVWWSWRLLLTPVRAACYSVTFPQPIFTTLSGAKVTTLSLEVIALSPYLFQVGLVLWQSETPHLLYVSIAVPSTSREAVSGAECGVFFSPKGKCININFNVHSSTSEKELTCW